MTEPVKKAEVAAAYNEWAETYDTDQNRTRDLAAEVLRKAGLSVTGRKVIEVGCGTGRNTVWLVERAAEIVGLDFSEEMLARARTRVGDSPVRFVQHDVRTTWPLPDASADVVIAMLVLEHVEQLEPVFAEAARTLVAGGELFVCELHPRRQLLGGQAQFTNKQTGERQLVSAFLHSTEDYLKAAASSSFELVSLADWHDEDALANPPRLLSLHLRVSGAATKL